MVEPQRGQMEPEDWQVVPQLEQVHTGQTFEGLVDGQQVVWPLNMVVALTLCASSQAQLDCGNSGKLKNSSHTASANSSQGGISQNP